MGHYSECYEEDARRHQKEKEERITNELDKLVKKIKHVEQKEFIIKVIQDIDSYIGFFKILKKM